MSIFYNKCNIKSGIIPECLFETKRNEFYNFIYSNVKFSVHTRLVGSQIQSERFTAVKVGGPGKWLRVKRSENWSKTPMI